MINKLVKKIKETNAPVVVGLDPMLSYIPKHITDKAYAEFGETLEGVSEALWQYNKGIIDATYHRLQCMNSLESRDWLHLTRL